MSPAPAHDDGPPRQTSDSVLLERAASGGRSAFAELYDRHVRAVYWQAYGVVPDADLAQDVTQEVFVTFWRRIRAVRVVDESVLPWLLVTARFTALNTRRRTARPDHGTEPLDVDRQDPAADVEAEHERALVRAEITRALSTLSPLERDLYERCVDGDLTYEAAARELGLTHAAVRNRVHRLRQRLRSELSSMRETS